MLQNATCSLCLPIPLSKAQNAQQIQQLYCPVTLTPKILKYVYI